LRNLSTSDRSILITGGAGFIGTNLARSYLLQGQPVHIMDSLSRPGVEQNVFDIERDFPGRVRFTQADVRDADEVTRAVQQSSKIFHLAAQVAVTTSLQDPVYDLETNLLGTVNVLEAVRRSATRPPILFTSTNKVYGHLEKLAVRECGSRYEPADEHVARNGVNEDQPLEFLSPYGCSKGSADQYSLDYARCYGLSVTVFRMSCIYGPYQLGSEDQGWVAHFLRQALKDEPITIYGDGKQVRDLLYVEDLVRAMHLASDNTDEAGPRVFNLGGGPQNAASLLDVLAYIESLTRRRIHINWGRERVGDQKWYVADTSKIEALLKWRPVTAIQDGIRALYDWYMERPCLAAQAEVQVA
jgi:CDP-paratose 2-epimerase